MPSLSLPKISRSSFPFSLFILVFVILLGELGYYYWLKRKPVGVWRDPEGLQRIADEKGEEGKKAHEKLKEEIKGQQAALKEKPVVSKNCLQVPPTDPEFGIERLEKVSENVFDYFYKGKVLRVEEKDYQSCPFIYLVLQSSLEFTLAIPAGFLSETDLGKVSALLYKEHLGERVQIKIRYEKDLTDSDKLKILEWQPLIFFVD